MWSISIEELEAAAMQLPPAERERDTPLQHEEEWAEEAGRRIAEMLNGTVDPVPGDEVFRAAMERLR